jgi:hypothetical protein
MYKQGATGYLIATVPSGRPYLQCRKSGAAVIRPKGLSIKNMSQVAAIVRDDAENDIRFAEVQFGLDPGGGESSCVACYRSGFDEPQVYETGTWRRMYLRL